MAIIAVSTIKDELGNVQRYVSRNLANGVDHLIVFTEDSGAAVEEFLDAHPSVTHVPTGRGWWGGRRPDDLNLRQRLNANAARVMLAPFEWAEWLVHIDGDEVAQIDRDVVAAFDPGVRVFRLTPLEVVSRSEEESRDAGAEEGEYFKRLLGGGELTLLKLLGVIHTADNKTYFHGHIRGKRGVRIRTQARIGLHTAKGGRGRFVKGVGDPALRVLHYDCPTAEEFARKWMTLAESGSKALYRKHRIPVIRALRALSEMDVAPEVRERVLRRIYAETTVEDVGTLRDLGLLTRIDADAGTHTPQVPPAADLAALAVLFKALSGRPLGRLGMDHPGGGYDLLAEVLAATGVQAGAAAALLPGNDQSRSTRVESA